MYFLKGKYWFLKTTAGSSTCNNTGIWRRCADLLGACSSQGTLALGSRRLQKMKLGKWVQWAIQGGLDEPQGWNQTIYFIYIDVKAVLDPVTKITDTKIAFLSQFSVPQTSFSLNIRLMNVVLLTRVLFSLKHMNSLSPVAVGHDFTYLVFY